jgi:hypothetical protein
MSLLGELGASHATALEGPTGGSLLCLPSVTHQLCSCADMFFPVVLGMEAKACACSVSTLPKRHAVFYLLHRFPPFTGKN